MENRKKWITLGLIVSMGASLVMGCGKQKLEATSSHEPFTATDASEEKTQETGLTIETSGTTQDNKEAVSGAADTENGHNAVFAEMANYGYTYASGAGGWSTELNVHDDGSFDGGYSDADMGDRGADYPNGTVYTCNFSGQFATPEKVNDYTYKTFIQNMEYANPVGKEEIEDGVRYSYTTAAGLDDAKDIYIYTKGAPVSDLPEEYLSWTLSMMEHGAAKLPWYGIYNETGEAGFFGWDRNSDLEGEGWTEDNNIAAGGDMAAENGIAAELSDLEDRAQEIRSQLENDSLPQAEMNYLSAELYTLWDDELNSIWKRLKNTLDPDTMDQLTQEERRWVAEKEKQVKAAGKEWAGGSGQKSAESLKEAELTQERVYELAEYLR